MDLSAEGTPRLEREKSIFFRPPHPSFSMQCQAALQVRVHSTTVFRLQVSPLRRSGLAELLVLYEGTILADDNVETARYQYDLLGRGTDYLDFHALCTLSFPLASLSLHALFQALRRHRRRLLRQRLDFFTPLRCFCFYVSMVMCKPMTCAWRVDRGVEVPDGLVDAKTMSNLGSEESLVTVRGTALLRSTGRVPVAILVSLVHTSSTSVQLEGLF